MVFSFINLIEIIQYVDPYKYAQIDHHTGIVSWCTTEELKIRNAVNSRVGHTQLGF